MPKKNKKVSVAPQPFWVLSRRAMVGWSVAIFFVCAWMFVIGVLVGRGTSALKIDISDLQKKLQAAGEDLKRQAQRQTLRPPDTAQHKTELEFYEALKKNREDTEISEMPSSLSLNKEMDGPPGQPPAFKKKVSLKRLTHVRSRAANAAAPPENKSAVASKPPPSGLKSEAKPVGNSYTIQVAAFKAVGDADKLVAELKQKGFSAHRKISKIPGKGIWYRVRIGAYHNKAEASKTLADLRKSGLQAVLVAK